MDIKKQISPNWESIEETNQNLSLYDRVCEAVGNPQASFPYTEGFIRSKDNSSNVATLVVPKIGWRDVEEVEAVRDTSPRCGTELHEERKWKVLKGQDYRDTTISPGLVIAWYEK